MMKTYQLKADVDNFKWVTPINDQDLIILDNLRGQSVKSEWRTLQLEYIVEKGDEELKEGDYPNLMASCPIVSEMAATLLFPIIKNEVEFLDVSIIGESRKFFLVNVLKILDCLDCEKSNIVRFSDGNIMMIKKYTFFEDKLKDTAIFRIKNAEKEIIVTESIFDIVVNSNLQGIKFKDTSEEEESLFASLLKKDLGQKRKRKKN